MDLSNSPYSKILNKTRTAGDGMESSANVLETKPPNITIPVTSKSTSSLPRLIEVFPTKIYKTEKKKSLSQSKSPKFVPYEPYTAAVKPIVPKVLYKGSKKSKNNMDINKLISQMSQMDTKLPEFKPRSKLNSSSDKVQNIDDKLCSENIKMQDKINELSKENEALKEQLKQQAQVNKELKTMLVASMGEDLETQVQSLNEDKKHLANALLNSAQHLSTHQEQTEWLAGQCEVWRSKFLASSLMVEELANWKKVLNERTELLQQAIKQLLDERCRARDMMLYAYRNLYSLHEKHLEDVAISECTGNKKFFDKPIGNLNLNTSMPHSTNILDLALVILKLSENVSNSIEKRDINHLSNLCCVTEGEKNAENIMALPVDIRKINEVPVNALVHHANNQSGNITRPVASCIHCNGRVQLL